MADDSHFITVINNNFICDEGHPFSANWYRSFVIAGLHLVIFWFSSFIELFDWNHFIFILCSYCCLGWIQNFAMCQILVAKCPWYYLWLIFLSFCEFIYFFILSFFSFLCCFEWFFSYYLACLDRFVFNHFWLRGLFVHFVKIFYFLLKFLNYLLDF